MPTSVENYIFNELPRRLVVEPAKTTGSSLTASWLIVATGDGFQTTEIDPATIGFEPEITQGTAGQYYRGDKTWAGLNAAAVGAIAASEKGQPLGVATLDADGYVQLSQMNPAVIERVVVVADEAARYALTTAQVQNGDVVNQQSPTPSSMWYVVDQTNLDNASGYLPFSSGVAASVAWSGITGKPAIIGDLGNISLATEGGLIQYVGGTWVNVSIATLKASLALEIADINSLQDDLDGKQSQSDVLDNLSSISTTGLVVRNSNGLFIGRELVGIDGITVTEPKGGADNPTLSLTETGVTAGTYGGEFNYPVIEIDKFGRNISVTTQAITRNPIQIQDVPSTTLQANTEHIFGNGITSYSSNLSLELPDNVPGGTWVKIKCGQDFIQATGSVTINAPAGKTIQGMASFPFTSSFKLYPSTTIDMVFSSTTNNWTLLTNASSFLSHLHVVKQGATDGLSNSHLIRSSATSIRTLDIPDRDVDLSSVGQTDFADNVFRVSDDDDSTKKIAFQASGIATGETRTITMPNANVDLGKVPTNLAYDSATAVLTQTLTDATSLSADLSATAVSQIVLTGSATAVVSATQPSTKYFLAGSSVTTFDVGAFTNTGKFIEIVNNKGSYHNITLTATGKSFKDEVNDDVAMPIILVRGESVFVFPVSATALQVYRNKPDIRNIKNNANTVTSGFKTTNLFVDSSTTVGHISTRGDELVRIFALAQATLSFGYPVYDARTDTQISTGSYTLYAGQVLEVTKTSATKWVILGGHIQDTSRFRLYNSSNVPTKFDTSAATAERTITMPDADVNLGALKSLNTLPVGVTNLVQLRAGHDYFVTQSGVILGIQTTSVLGLYDTSIGYSFSNTTSSDLTVTVRWTAGTGTPGLVKHIDAISGSTIASALLTLTPTYDYVYTLPKGGTLRLLPNAASNVTILRSFSEFYGQMAKGVFTPVELLASANTQNLAPNYSYYLPALYVGALNLAMPVGAAIGTTFDISSIYSNGVDGTLGANLTALNLAVPAGEYITGWGSATSPINLLVSYETASNGYRTPNFTQGCTFRLTKTGATSWAIKPTFGSALPKRFIVKNEGSGGTTVNTTVPSGTSRELTLPNADVDLGTMSSVATTDGNNLSGTRCRILGGSNNTVSGTDVVAVGCNRCDLTQYLDNVTAIGLKNTTNIYAAAPRHAILLGSSALLAPADNISGAHAAALGVIQCVYSAVNVANGTAFNATLDGSNTPSSTNCIKLMPAVSVLSSAVIDLDFIIVVGDNMSGAMLAPRRTIFAKRRVYVVFAFNDSDVGAFSSSTEVIGTDTSVGSAATGTVTVGVTVDSANNRLIPTVSATSGYKQTLFQFGVRSTAHYNRNI